jgi:hypothetical protein
LNNSSIINKKKNLEIFLIISWIICLLSIGVNFENPLSSVYQDKKNYILSYINLFRYLGPTILLPLLTYFFFKFEKKIYPFHGFFFCYCLWQLIIFILLKKNLDFLQNWQLIFNLFSILLIFHLANSFNVDFEKKLLFIFVFFIFVILLYFSYEVLLDYIKTKELLYLYHSKVLHPNTKIFEQEVPRVTGLSRMAVIIFYFIFFIKDNLNNKKLVISCALFLCLLSVLIYAFNTRTGLLGMIILIIFYIFFIKKLFFEKIFNILIIIIIPIIIFETINYNKNYMKDNLSINNNNLPINDKNLFINNRLVHNQTSSGRLEIWGNSLEIIKENKIIFGTGPQADRVLLGDYLKKNKLNKNFIVYENNSSNAIIYSYLCGGIISLSFLFFIYFLIFKKIFANLFLKNNIHNNVVINFSITTLLFLTIRTFFENGYAVFGIDFCLCCLCYFMLIKSENFPKKISSET